MAHLDIKDHHNRELVAKMVEALKGASEEEATKMKIALAAADADSDSELRGILYPEEQKGDQP